MFVCVTVVVVLVIIHPSHHVAFLKTHDSIAEIFPLYARDTAMAVGIFINWIANWFVAFSFPILLEYTQPYTFLVFVSTTAYFLYFTVRYVPETKGLTVAQVTQEFERIPLKV